MPRFYFNFYEEDPIIDDEGLELVDLREAREEALRGARDIAAARVLSGQLNLNHSVEVQDEQRRPLLNIPFAAAVQLKT